jgi:hypothetical protein
MSDVGDAIGTAVEGGLYAKAVSGDPSARMQDKGHFDEGACLNCGTPLVGSHCHACGQKAHLHRTIGGFLHDLLHGVLHFEGKTWHTIRDLTWRPGRLTRDYIDGRRQRYVSPIALFLFVVFISFAAFQIVGGASALTPDSNVDSLEAVEQEYQTTLSTLEERREELREARREDAPVKNLSALESDIGDLEIERDALAGAMRLMGSENLPADASTRAVEVETEQKSTWQKAKENPQLLAYKMQTNAYKFAWLLIPISVPFVWLLFCWNRRFKLYDHTIFTTYSIAFMLALAGISALLIYLGTWKGYTGLQVAGSFLLLYAPVHMYRHVRGTYDSSRLGAFLRMLLLSAFAWLSVGLFGAALTSMA